MIDCYVEGIEFRGRMVSLRLVLRETMSPTNCSAFIKSGEGPTSFTNSDTRYYCAGKFPEVKKRSGRNAMTARGFPAHSSARNAPA